MIFEPRKLEQNDIDLYFRHSCFRLRKPKGQGEWVSYEGFNSPKRQFQFSTAKGKLNLDRKELDLFQIECIYPFGFFNTKCSVVFAERKGTRQSLKGLCMSGTTSLTGIEWIVKNTVTMPPLQEGSADNMAFHVYMTTDNTLTPEFCATVFDNPEYPELDEAKALIRSGDVFARALSTSIALVPHHRTGDYLVFIHELAVGELRSKDVLKVTSEEFRSELAAFFEPRGVELK